MNWWTCGLKDVGAQGSGMSRCGSMRTRDKKTPTDFLPLMCKIVVSRKLLHKAVMGTGEKYRQETEVRYKITLL